MKASVVTLKAVGAIVLMAIATSCGSPQWHVEGTIDGAGGKSLVLQAPNATGQWYGVDTVEVKSNGKFSFAGDPVGYPEVFRLSLDGRAVYVPIDSVETVKVSAADGAAFESGSRIWGSPAADAMQRLNDEVAASVAALGADGALASDSLKLSLTQAILADPAGIVAYYLLNKRIDGRPIFNFADKRDLRVLGAVANAYNEQRPADPRTSMLRDTYTRLRRAGSAAPTRTIEAEEISLPEIALLDENGQRQSLSQLAGKGCVVVLNFTAYGADESPAFNIALADLYKAYHDRGLEIYQVSLDADEFFWRQTARNLPWTTVYNSPADGAALLATYNVGTLPSLFVINRKGELAERVGSMADLRKAVSRHL